MATVSNDQVRFNGRILFLSEDADVVESQLRGTDVSLADALPLRDDVSTDEITPVPILTHYDDALGRFPYTGFKVGDRLPIRPGSVREGAFPSPSPASATARVRRANTARPRRSWPASGWSSPRASSASIGRTPTTSASSPPPTWG